VVFLTERVEAFNPWTTQRRLLTPTGLRADRPISHQLQHKREFQACSFSSLSAATAAIGEILSYKCSATPRATNTAKLSKAPANGSPSPSKS
jgi:hypothetical protein